MVIIHTNSSALGSGAVDLVRVNTDNPIITRPYCHDATLGRACSEIIEHEMTTPNGPTNIALI